MAQYTLEGDRLVADDRSHVLEQKKVHLYAEVRDWVRTSETAHGDAISEYRGTRRYINGDVTP